ncbi:MAG: 4-hydroxybutyrate CoA-transferase [Spirochaetes bacterium]|jgi:4-hydroxybutyrate CoA-transferase|nr:4-hydroxybutyrate CoA-transferase [Spirochaetota bacterium]
MNLRFDWKTEYRSKKITAEEAAKYVESGDYVGVQGGTGIPPAFGEALGKRSGELSNVTVCQGFATALHEYMKPERKESFRVESIFIGPAERFCLQHANADFVPAHLGNLGGWLDERRPRVVATMATPPDEEGFMNLSCFGGLSTMETFRNAEILIVEVNKNIPWLCTDTLVLHVSEVTAIIENDSPLFEFPEIPITAVEEKIAGHIASLVGDGSTLQLGLGGLANCIGHFLKDKKDLGIHSEVVSNSIMELVKCGSVNNSMKNHLTGICAYTFCIGTKGLMEFLDRNSGFRAFEIGYLNDPNIIARNDNFVSINNALMVDMTGQVASESIGHTQYSATGGQAAFVRGAQMSKGGKSIIALPSTYTGKDSSTGSRIMTSFPPGTAVTTTRCDVDWIATEYGAVRLKNEPVSGRVKKLISIAHPDFRDGLTFEAKKLGWI